MQRHIQKQHLKENLFEKRWKVYSAVDEYLTELLRNGDDFDTDAAYREFRRVTDPGEFLFGQAVWAHIKAIDNTSLQLRTARTTLKHDEKIVQHPATPTTPKDQQRLNAAQSRYGKAEVKENALVHVLSGFLYGGTKDLFSKELRLDELDPWYARLEAYMERQADCNEQRLKTRYEKPSA